MRRNKRFVEITIWVVVVALVLTMAISVVSLS